MSFAEYGYYLTDKNPSEQWAANEYNVQYRGTGEGTFSRDASQAVATYLVEYEYHERFLDVVLGKTVKVGSQLRRSNPTGVFDPSWGSLPEEHPYYYNFYASSASVSPKGVPSETIGGTTWPKATINVVFRPPTYNVLEDSGNTLPEYQG